MSRCSSVIYHGFVQKGEGVKWVGSWWQWRQWHHNRFLSESENRTATSNWLINYYLWVLKTILNFIIHMYLIIIAFVIIMWHLCSSVSYVSNNTLWHSNRIKGNIYFMILMHTCNLLIWALFNFMFILWCIWCPGYFI